MTLGAPSSRRAARVARSRVAVRLGLIVYSALSALLLLRCMVLVLQFPNSVNSVAAIIATTDPIVFPLTVVPGAHRSILAGLSLADVTAAVVLIAAPLLLVGRQTRG